MVPRFASLLLATFVFATAQAQEFSLDPTKLTSIVPPPPDDHSPAGMADMETMLRVQEDRSPSQIKRAKRVESQSPFSFARPVLGEWFHSKDLPRTAAIFDLINRQANRVIDASKDQWSRPRPYQRSDHMLLVVGRPGNSSYPSGHSACAAVWAAILSAAFPEDAAAFQKQVHEVMWCRVIGGVHFPSDTTAGEKLGDAIGQALLSQPDIQKAIKTIQQETAPFRLKKAA